MRNPYALLIIVLASCVPPAWGQGYADLDISDVRARFFANGRVAFDTLTNQPVFEVPQGGGANANFSGGLWIGGLTTGGQARVACTMYDSGWADLFHGPLRVAGGTTNASEALPYNHVWKVSREQIATHLSFFNCLADPNCSINDLFPSGYIIPQGIADWPAMGNLADGYAPYLAPFYDFDLDGSYNAQDGDAPCILGDQALFSVFNDYLGYTGTPFLRIEVHQMPFTYATGDPMLDQTVFVRYHVINRSTQTYSNVMFGSFNDFDLGCSSDDFIGSDPSRNLYYVYNWDDNDESCLGAIGYGEQPPAVGITLLKGPLADANSVDDPPGDALPAWNGFGFGDGITDNERHGISSFMYFNRESPNAYITDPSNSTHFYNYLNATWKDGTPLSYGGNGYSTSPDAVTARFMYPGADDPIGAGTNGQIMPPWSETDPTPATVDRRGILGSGPITLEPGAHVDLLFAYVYARASSGGAIASVAALQARVDSVRAFASTLPIWNVSEESGFTGQCADYALLGIEDVGSLGGLVLSPSPASDIVQFRAPREIAGGLLIVRDATGRAVIEQRVLPELNIIHVEQLASGVYTCDAVSRNARCTGRLVKQ